MAEPFLGGHEEGEITGNAPCNVPFLSWTLETQEYLEFFLLLFAVSMSL